MPYPFAKTMRTNFAVVAKLMFVVATMVTLVGCLPSLAPPNAANNSGPTPTSANPSTPPPQTSTMAAQPQPLAPAETQFVPAQAGVGQQGRSLDAHEGMIVTPVKAYFASKERVFFDVELPKSLQLYAAQTPDGQGPKSHDEFMREVIDANNYRLPQLPPGHRYQFDPKTQQLMVERPRSAATPTTSK